MRTRASLVVAAAVGLATSNLGLPSRAEAAPFAITRWTVDAGGSSWIQNGTFILGGTAGQPDAGLLASRSYTLNGGFWLPGAPPPVAVEETPPPDAPPLAARIGPPMPNLFVTRARIAFDLPESRPVRIEIFDVGGALLRTLAKRSMPAGRHALEWDGADAQGRRVPAGLYFVRVALGDLHRSQKLIVLR